LANDLPALYQLGKNGITDEFLAQIEDALSARELIKINVLKNAFQTPKEVMKRLCGELGCEAVSAVGSKAVVYRRAEDKKKVKIEI
jgi:RNA-binding protein